MNERSWEIWQTDTHRFCRRAQLVDKEIIEKFAELIIGHATECVRDVLRDENSDLSYEAASQVQTRIKEYFGVEETKGWVCPKCGTDRTKAVCPKGHHAALTGDCPMIGVAQ